MAKAAQDGAAQGQCQLALGELSRRRGDYAARERLEQARASAVARSDPRAEAAALRSLGVVVHNQGEYGQARALYEESLALARGLGDKRGIANSLQYLGVLAHAQGEYGQARALLEESLALSCTLGDKQGIAHTMAVLIALAVATSQIERAARLAGSVDALLQALGTVLQSLERGLYDAAVNIAREQLDAAMFDALWAKGQAMTLEQAVVYALEQADGDAENSTPAAGFSLRLARQAR